MRKRGEIVMVLMFLAGGIFSSCAKPSREMQMLARECEKQDQVTPVKEKNPVLGATLGLVWGGGSFYTRQYELGLLDALTWPVSMLWDPWLGYQGAKRINAQATIDACRELRWQKRQASSGPLPPSPDISKP